jgi:hypothetical protein
VFERLFLPFAILWNMEGDRIGPSPSPRSRNRMWTVRFRRGLAVVVVFAIVMALTLGGTIAILLSGWTTALLDPIRGDPQAQLAVASGSGSDLYVAYTGISETPGGGSFALKLSSNVGGRWASTLVASAQRPRYGLSFYDPSIAVDAAGHVYLAFGFDNGTYGLSTRYGTNAGGAWAFEIIHSNQDESSPAIAVDSRGLVHLIFYWSRDYTCYCVHLEYATNSEGAWTNSTVLNVPDTMVGQAGLALDSQGNAIIGVSRSIEAGGVAIVTNAAGAWRTQTLGDLAEPGREGMAIAVDAGDHIHLVYPVIVPDGSGNATGRLHYATNAQGAWSITELPWETDRFTTVSLMLDSANRAHIAFSDRDGGLVYAGGSPGNWIATSLPSAHPGGWANSRTAVAVPGPGSRVHILFTQSRNYPEPSGLFYLTNGVDSTNHDAFWARALPVLYLEGVIFGGAGIVIATLPRLVARWRSVAAH